MSEQAQQEKGVAKSSLSNRPIVSVRYPIFFSCADSDRATLWNCRLFGGFRQSNAASSAGWMGNRCRSGAGKLYARRHVLERWILDNDDRPPAHWSECC